MMLSGIISIELLKNQIYGVQSRKYEAKRRFTKWMQY